MWRIGKIRITGTTQIFKEMQLMFSYYFKITSLRYNMDWDCTTILAQLVRPQMYTKLLSLCCKNI